MTMPSYQRPIQNPEEVKRVEEEDSGPNVRSKLETIIGEEHDLALAGSQYLTCCEVIKRRSRRVKQTHHIYKEHYWSLMEKVKTSYRDYYWIYGKSPFIEDQRNRGCLNDGTDGAGQNGRLETGLGEVEGKCVMTGCNAKAMALTRFCHAHILSDSNQKLYTGCTYVIKRAHAGAILCGKPVQRSSIPALCTMHLKKSESCLKLAFKKHGLNVTSPSKLVPKFHVLVMEYVRQIQSDRRATS